MKLYELTGAYAELQSMEEDKAVIDTLEAIEGEIQLKAEKVAMVLSNIDSDISAIDEEIKRLTAKKKAIKNRHESLKDYLRENMERCEIKKIESPLFTINCVAGRDSLSVDDEELAKSSKFIKTTVALDKTAALAELKAGGEIPGLSITKSKSSIRIK